MRTLTKGSVKLLGSKHNATLKHGMEGKRKAGRGRRRAKSRY